MAGAGLLLVGALLLGGGYARSSYLNGVGWPVSQPVPFSHKHHVGELGIDCRYCHVDVETGAEASLPDDPRLRDQTVIALVVPDSTFMSYIQVIRSVKRKARPQHLYWLVSTEADVKVERRAANVLRLTPAHGPADGHCLRNCDGPARLARAGRGRRDAGWGQAGMTLSATVAETSSCSRTVTSWEPSDLIGLPTAMVRLSTSWPEALLSASAMSVMVTDPKSRPASPARTWTGTGAASSRVLTA